MIHSSNPPVYILRGLLRYLRPPTQGTAIKHPTTQRVTVEYLKTRHRAAQSLESRDQGEALRLIASEYYTLRRDIAERSKLHQLDSGAEDQLSPMELSRRAAARAGLQLPEIDHNL